MLIRPIPSRYGPLSISLHWLMLLLLVAVYACMELRGYYPRGSATRDALKTWHYMLGLSVFGLVWLRLLVNLRSTAPGIEPAPPGWQKSLAKWIQAALYLFMMVMPLAGWLILSAEGNVIPFFGLELPALIAKSKTTAKTIQGLHEIGATAGYFLVGLHAAAALFHHYVVRDNTLRRMLPGRH